MSGALLRSALVATALGGMVAACDRSADRPADETIPAAAPASAARPALVTTAESLAGELESPRVVVLHVERTREPFEAARIPGARFLPLGAIVTERDGLPNELPEVPVLDSVFESLGVTDDARVVLYGDPLAAARAFFTLDVLGHGDHVTMLDGGVEAWRAAGRAVVTGPDTMPAVGVATGGLTPRLAAEVMVDAQWISARTGDPRIALVDARPPEEFSGAVPGDGVTRPGHIPGAANLFWKQALVSDSIPRLHDTTTLRELFAAAGAEPGDTVVTYCRTGVQASHAYFVARLLGYTVRMYDGSYLDWNRVASRPIREGQPRTP